MTGYVYKIQKDPFDTWTIKKTKNPHITTADQAWLYAIKKGTEANKDTKHDYGYFSKPDIGLCDIIPGKILKNVYFDPDLTIDAQYWQVKPSPAHIVCVYWDNPDVKTGNFQQPCNTDGTCNHGYVCSKKYKICLKGEGALCSNSGQCASGICSGPIDDTRCGGKKSSDSTMVIIIILIIIVLVYIFFIRKKDNKKEITSNITKDVK